MNTHLTEVVTECTRGSDEGKLRFPEVVKKLMEVGVERYHTDLCRAEKTYYLPDGTSAVVPTVPVGTKPAEQFSASGVEAALRAIQANEISYKQFCERIAAAGCVDYVVSLAGRRAIYSGRTGELYVEKFPGAQ